MGRAAGAAPFDGLRQMRGPGSSRLNVLVFRTQPKCRDWVCVTPAQQPPSPARCPGPMFFERLSFRCSVRFLRLLCVLAANSPPPHEPVFQRSPPHAGPRRADHRRPGEPDAHGRDRQHHDRTARRRAAGRIGLRGRHVLGLFCGRHRPVAAGRRLRLARTWRGQRPRGRALVATWRRPRRRRQYRRDAGHGRARRRLRPHGPAARGAGRDRALLHAHRRVVAAGPGVPGFPSIRRSARTPVDAHVHPARERRPQRAAQLDPHLRQTRRARPRSGRRGLGHAGVTHRGAGRDHPVAAPGGGFS